MCCVGTCWKIPHLVISCHIHSLPVLKPIKTPSSLRMKSTEAKVQSDWSPSWCDRRSWKMGYLPEVQRRPVWNTKETLLCQCSWHSPSSVSSSVNLSSWLTFTQLQHLCLIVIWNSGIFSRNSPLTTRKDTVFMRTPWPHLLPRHAWSSWSPRIWSASCGLLGTGSCRTRCKRWRELLPVILSVQEPGFAIDSSYQKVWSHPRRPSLQAMTNSTQPFNKKLQPKPGMCPKQASDWSGTSSVWYWLAWKKASPITFSETSSVWDRRSFPSFRMSFWKGPAFSTNFDYILIEVWVIRSIWQPSFQPCQYPAWSTATSKLEIRRFQKSMSW